jgi:predicted transposase YbfD/YdcC
VAEDGRAKQDWLAPWFRWPNGIPWHETFRRIFGLLDPEAFQRGFARGTTAWATCGVGIRRTIPLEGKTARRSSRPKQGEAALHLVSAWASANRVTLGQVAMDDQSNQITAIPRLRELLDLSGALVTLDARGCPKEIAGRIVSGGGDYLLAVKENQPHLDQDLEDSFLAALETDFAGLEWSVAETEEIHRGRREVREGPVMVRPAGWRDAGLWQG